VLTYSPHTLSRATHETAGRSAKQFIDDRAVLEALAARRASCRWSPATGRSYRGRL